MDSDDVIIIVCHCRCRYRYKIKKKKVFTKSEFRSAVDCERYERSESSTIGRIIEHIFFSVGLTMYGMCAAHCCIFNSKYV